MTTHARRLVREIESLARQLTASDEVAPATASQKVALTVVADLGPLRVGALADKMGTTDATASRAVDALVALGLVDRLEDADDRRAVLIAVTPAGRKLIDRRRTELAKAFERGLRDLPPEDRDRLVALLERLNTGLRES
jgi:DNA-binding MarR family transcriptional regulator